MKNLFLIICLIYSCAMYGQTENVLNAANQFSTYYNEDKFESIHALLSESMQQNSSSEEIAGFLQGVKQSVGKIVEKEFVQYDESSFAVFKTQFESMVLALSLSVNEANEIDGFKITPFVEEDLSRTVVNKLKQVDYINEEQMKTLFELTKTFPNGTQVAIGIIENGVTNYYGIKMENDTLLNNSNHQDIFEIGSISKVFTSILLANQVMEGRIKLSDKINSYFDFPFKDNIALTFLELANHSSGLPKLPSNLDLSKVDPDNPYKSYGSAALNQYLRKELLQNDSLVGVYQYSNLGAGLLGYTLNAVNNSTYEELLQAQILKKHGMNHTTSKRTAIVNKLVKGLDAQGQVTANWDFESLVGAGGIFSNVEDMTKFANAHFNPNNQALQLCTKRTIRVDEKMGIGLGWHLLESASGQEWIWHNGGTGGYTSSVAMDLKAKNAIVLLTNVSAFSPKMGYVDKLCFSLLESLEEKK